MMHSGPTARRPASPAKTRTGHSSSRVVEPLLVRPNSPFGELVEICRRSVHFQHFLICGTGIPQLGAGSGNIVATDIDHRLLQRMQAENWHERDAPAVAARERDGIVRPADVAAIAAADPVMVERLRIRREEFGLTVPYVIPVARGGKAIGAVFFHRSEPLTAREEQYLQMIAGTIHREALRINPPDLRRHTPTGRELSCLKLSSRGMTNAEIAVHFAISAQTVAFHIKRCCLKLAADNKAAAVAEAIRRELID